MPKPGRRTGAKKKSPKREVKKDFSVGVSFKKAFDLFKRNREPFLRLVLFQLMCTAAEVGLIVLWGEFHKTEPVLGGLLWALSKAFSIACWLLTIALMRLALRTVKGKKSALKIPFGFWRCAARYLFSSVLVFVAILVGFLLLVIPGLVVTAGLSLAGYAAMEYRTSVLKSLRVSWELTRGVKWKIAGLFLMTILMEALGLLCCGVGLIVVRPVIHLAWVVAYRELERQTRLPKFESLKAKV